ncbi:MAG: hypothetical protein H6669_05195 [Ardenticatenaceae bacterium]|nr:hypothetical protein [Ardenticatenaceae bacterium]
MGFPATWVDDGRGAAIGQNGGGKTNGLVTDCRARGERPFVFRWVVVVGRAGEAVGGERPSVFR